MKYFLIFLVVGIFFIGDGAAARDTTYPIVSIAFPADGQTVSGIVTISAKASDNVGVVGVQFKLDDKNLGTEDTSNPYSTPWDSTTVSNGEHFLTAVARDKAGNQTAATVVYFFVNNTTESSTLFTEGFDDNDFSSRGWFDDTSVSLDKDVWYAGAGSLKLTWSAGGTRPVDIGAMRKSFTATDSLYVSMYWGFSGDWVGSGEAYHPHLVMVMSDLDDPWGGLAYTYLDTYIETSNLTPRLLIQDGINVNSKEGALPNDLTNITEKRDVSGCNGCLSGSDCGVASSCYRCGGRTYCNGRGWDGPSDYFVQDKWHKVETYFKMNSIKDSRAVPDGIMQMWVDGTRVIDHGNIVYRTNQRPTMKWATLVIAPWIGDGSPQSQTMWIDELTVGNSLPAARECLD